MVVLGWLGKLFGRKTAAGPVGVKMKRGTDVVQTPLICPSCRREIATFTPDKGIATCKCGSSYAIIDYEPRPLPNDLKLDDST